VSSPSGSNETQLSELKAQVRARLKSELDSNSSIDTSSREYHQFRAENLPSRSSWFEQAALFAGKTLSIQPGNNKEKIEKNLGTAHLGCSAADVVSLSILAPFAVFILLIILTVFVPFMVTGTLSLYYLIFSIILSVMIYVPLANMPAFLAQRHRQEASNQMVLSVFYLVTFMRHTPNLERAMQFAAEHIGSPLSLDFKKIIWNVETEKFQTISESLEDYLIQWRESAREYIEAIHLIQSSLYETSNDRRVNSLDKALDVMLNETYEKMLHYAQDLKGPMTMLHMLGIILPILGLVILPLAVSFFTTHWTVIASGYNVILPLGVFYLGKRILSSRPTGYGSSDNVLTAEQTQANKSALTTSITLAVVLLTIGLSPIIIHAINPSFELSFGAFELMGYQETPGGTRGPFGLGAGLLSLCITLGVGISVGLYYFKRVKDSIKIRRKTKELELEFASALFQLGNRIGDGIPVELAFGRVAQVMEGTRAGEFFIRVATNIQKLGMGVQEALFDEQHGVLKDYPSSLIESSMKVLVESSRKGPMEASKALMSMSNYIKEMHRVDERLRDLLSDVLSSMKSQINFLLPVIAGIVIGITSMITTVLGAVQAQGEAFASSGVGSVPLDSFGFGIPTYFFQIIVGVYVVQVVLILTYMISGIENGVDPLSEDYLRGKSLLSATSLYVGIAFVIILIFNLIAGQIIGVTA
jgi:Flp pilus assembly protein TadB